MLEKRALAAARPPEDPEDLTGANLETDVLQYDRVTVPDGHILDFNDRFAVGGHTDYIVDFCKMEIRLTSGRKNRLPDFSFLER
jgi:hypothetical protein